MKTSQIYKEGRAFFYCPPGGWRPVEMTILMDGGPLCVSHVYDHFNKKSVDGLYWIYIKKHGAHFGPFFAEITLAHKAIKKILKEFKPVFFEQPLAWIRRQTVLKDWMEKNVGKSEDLIGAEWAKDDESGGSK